MSIVIVHGYAHRLTQAGIIESAVAVEDNRTDVLDGITVYRADWHQRGPESMDLLGGDYELIRELLQRLSDVFKDGQRRTPVTPIEYEAVVIDAMKAI